MRTIKYIVIHCADTYPEMDIGVTEIDRWHKQRGWKGVGYHYVIRRNGIIEVGRTETKTGAHVAGYNLNSIGICYAGGKGKNGKPEDNRTEAQKISLINLVTDLKIRYPEAKVVGHHDLNPAKSCPCFDMQTLNI